MVDVFFIISFLVFMHILYTLIETEIGLRTIKNLSTQISLPKSKLPSVSIIFSALNEAENMKAALTTMLQLTYPQFEIIAINDRSSDETGAILESFAKEYSNLQVIHVSALPENWLGKNHALCLGAKKAKGEWLLFTDADVFMNKFLLVKAMSYAIENNLDHLTIFEKHIQHSFWLKVILLGSYITYCLKTKPWRVRYSWSKRFFGHGAFNLIKKSSYQSSGGHQAIALECLDDFALGRLIKNNGFKQDTVSESGYIEREWYSSLRGMIQGLTKNGFAYYDFKFKGFGGDFLLFLSHYFWPFLGILCFDGPVFWLNMLSVITSIYLASVVAAQFQVKRLYAFVYPLGILLMVYTVCYSIFLTYRQNGIYWRNTHYLLQKLRDKPIPGELIDK